MLTWEVFVALIVPFTVIVMFMLFCFWKFLKFISYNIAFSIARGVKDGFDKKD